MALHCPDSLTHVARFIDGLSPDKLDQLGDIYSPGIEFRDPMHHVRGHAALRNVFEQLFQQLAGLTVSVDDAHGDDRTGFLLWTMRYQYRAKQREITGTSHFRFASDGRIVFQQDHWDASFPVYGEFPVLGWAMRGIRRMVGGRPSVENPPRPSVSTKGS